MPEAQITPGVLTFHPANETIIYHWFSYVPTGLNKQDLIFILITGQNGNIISDDYNLLMQETQILAEWKKDEAEYYKFIMITPVIPRSASQPEIYTVALDRESLMGPDDFLHKPDLKVNLMIDELSNMLKDSGYKVHDKVFIEGFSAGAMFAQRYCLLHPDRVQAIAAGQCGGSATLPVEEYNNTEMNWPVGINDFQSLVGYDFNFELYKKVPQFIYIGDQDTKNSTLAPGCYDLFTDEQKNFLNDNFGNTDPIRLQNQCEYMKGLECNIEFKLYTGEGHTWSHGEDVFGFLSKYKDTIFPDLTGEWNSLTQSCRNLPRGTRCTLKGKFTIQNIGNKDASSSTVKFYLSDNNSYNEGDIFLKQMSTGKIKIGGSKIINLNINLPTGQTATGKYVIALVDAENIVVESNEANNNIVYGPIP